MNIMATVFVMNLLVLFSIIMAILLMNQAGMQTVSNLLENNMAVTNTIEAT